MTTTPLPGATLGQAPATDETTKRLLEMLTRSAQTPQIAAKPHPIPIPGRVDTEAAGRIGMNTEWPAAWGFERFAGQVGGQIRNAVSELKERQVSAATADWEYVKEAGDELEAAKAGGDEKGIAAAQSKLKAIMGDPKKVKRMQKALQMGWMDPKGSDAYLEGLNRMMKQAKEEEQKKRGAAENLKKMVRPLLRAVTMGAVGGQKEPQLTPDEQGRMSKELYQKIPVTRPQLNPLDVERYAVAIKDLRATPEKYKFQVLGDPPNQKIVALDQTDPTKPYIEVKSASGELAKPPEKRFPGEGKLEVQNGYPTGRVMHNGRYVLPGRPGYTKEDEEAVNLALGAIGLGDKEKEKLAAIRGGAYAAARAAYQEVPIVDAMTGEAGFDTLLNMARNPGKYVPPAEAEKIATREAVHGSLNANFKAIDKDLAALPNGLDTETQATIKLALKGDDPGVLETLLINKIKEHAPDETLRYLSDLKAMQEDILVLRTVGGMGAGSDMMRNAMIRTVVGPGTSSVKEAHMQMDAAKRTTEALFARRPFTQFTGDMETQTYKGSTYQRKKGSNDPWTLAPKRP